MILALASSADTDKTIWCWIIILLFAVPATADRLIFGGLGSIYAIDPVPGATPVPLIPGLIDAVSEIQGFRDDDYGRFVSQDLSPDGQTLAFISYGWFAVGATDIWTVNMDGTDLKILLWQERYANWRDKHGNDDWDLTLPTFFTLSWSPDGTEIAYMDVGLGRPGGQAGLHFMIPEGGTPPDSLFDNRKRDNRKRNFAYGVPSGKLEEASPGYHLNWPPGERIFYSTIWMDVFSVNRKEPDPKLLHEGENPAVSPDGNRVVFNFRDTDTFKDSIYVMGSNGTDPKSVTSGCCPTWSPDGNSIAYLDNGYLRVMDADGSNQLEISPIDYLIHPFSSTDLDWIGVSNPSTVIRETSWGTVKREQIAE